MQMLQINATLVLLVVAFDRLLSLFLFPVATATGWWSQRKAVRA
jgi:hypothetical protein